MQELLRPIYAEWAHGNWRAGEELFAPELVFRARVGEGLVTAQGSDEVRAFLSEFLDTWSDYAVEADEFRENGDTVFVAGRQRGKGTTSGMAVEVPIFQVWRFEEGRAVSILSTPHEQEALEEAGLS